MRSIIYLLLIYKKGKETMKSVGEVATNEISYLKLKLNELLLPISSPRLSTFVRIPGKYGPAIVYFGMSDINLAVSRREKRRYL